MSKEYVKLVFSGSGTAFYVHYGAYKKIEEIFNIKDVVGTSGGSIIASLIALDYTPNQIQKILYEINLGENKDISINPFYRLGIISGDKITQILKKYLNKKFKETFIPLTVIVTNLKTGKAEYFSTEKTPENYIYEVVRASISIPILFKYVKINDFIAVDGGLCHNFAIDFKTSDLKTIGLKISCPNSEIKPFEEKEFNLFDGKSWQRLFFGFFEYFFLLMNIVLNNLEKKHIEDGLYSQIIELKTEKNNLSFEHTKRDIQDMIFEGYNSVEKYFNR